MMSWRCYVISSKCMLCNILILFEAHFILLFAFYMCNPCCFALFDETSSYTDGISCYLTQLIFCNFITYDVINLKN